MPRLKASIQPIEVVIPVVRKDLEILPLCIEGIRQCVENDVKDIYVVAPNDDKIRLFCTEHGLTYMEESSVMGFAPSDIDLMIAGRNRDRSNWLFQQLIKLSGNIGSCDNYLCIDADHILIRPHIFVTEDGTHVFYKSHEYHKPYNDNVACLTGIKHFSFLSYVAHKMCFNKKEIEALHKSLERRFQGKTWIQAILGSYDRTQLSGFSEFQLYGHFTDNKIERPWKAHSLKYDRLDSYDHLRKKYSGLYAALTFPNYKK